MPTIDVTGPPMTDEQRAKMARTLTTGIAAFVGVDPVKVSMFFYEDTPGPCRIVVKAVKNGRPESAWSKAVRDAIGHTWEISIHLFDANRTAKGGVLRENPANPSTPDSERP